MKRILMLLCLVVTISINVGCRTTTQAGDVPGPVAVITDDGRFIEHRGYPGLSALAALRRLAEVETRTLAFGEFVISINGVVADGDDSFWSFYVNGEKSMRGASEVIAKPGDRFSWQWTPRQIR